MRHKHLKDKQPFALRTLFIAAGGEGCETEKQESHTANVSHYKMTYEIEFADGKMAQKWKCRNINHVLATGEEINEDYPVKKAAQQQYFTRLILAAILKNFKMVTSAQLWESEAILVIQS